ncbi:GTP-binding protein [Tulasnella sp. 331]|nr:GTP-binding protein [Tulasnella sp. 331]
MSSLSPDDERAVPIEMVLFSGQDTEDVTVFLQKVKQAAVLQGRPRDQEWMIDYAEACLTGPALRWFDNLDGNIRKSWKTTRKAFLSRFDSPSSPTPARALPHPPARPVATSTPRAPTPASVPTSDDGPRTIVKNVLVIGDSGVGKSCLIERFLGHGWAPYITPTEEINYQTWIGGFHESFWRYHIWDVPGGRMAGPNYSEGITRFWIVYDVTNAKSFKNVHSWYQSIKPYQCTSDVFALLANKCDLLDDRVISEEEGRKMATEYGMVYRETSARTNQAIPELRGPWAPNFAKFRPQITLEDIFRR